MFIIRSNCMAWAQYFCLWHVYNMNGSFLQMFCSDREQAGGSSITCACAGAHGVFAAAALTEELQLLLPAAYTACSSQLPPLKQAVNALLHAPNGPALVAALAVNVPQAPP